MNKELMHEGLLELLVHLIKARDLLHKVKDDEELEIWFDGLAEHLSYVSEIYDHVSEILGGAIGGRIENNNKI